jgi:RNA polymerase sigma-70 factor (ECF subfamily)
MNTEELLAHNDFLRALARMLVIDEHSAADITQDTWTAALQHSPNTDRPLKPWLAKVMRNFARMLRRGDDRRGARERVAAIPEDIPSSEAIVEKEEIRRKVIDAVLSLDEPYRSVIVLRFYQELSLKDAARRLDIPLDTMRSRLKKALELLKCRLDSDFGGKRAAWIAALEPFVFLKATESSSAAVTAGISSLVTGGIIMSIPVKIGLLSALVLSAALFAVLMDPAADPEDILFAEVETEPGVVEPDGTEKESAGERIRLDVVSGPYSEGTAVIPGGKILGRIFDVNHFPLQGVRVSVTNIEPEVESLSGPDGRFEVEIPVESLYNERALSVVFRKSGYTRESAEVSLHSGEVHEVKDTILEPGGNLRGLVTDNLGNPINDAEVYLTLAETIAHLDQAHLGCFGPVNTFEYRLTRTGEDGTFFYEGFPVGWCRVWAVTKGTRFAWTEPVEVVEGGETDNVGLMLERDTSLRSIGGYVLTPDGKPLPRAKLEFHVKSTSKSLFCGSTSHGLKVDETGHFYGEIDQFVWMDEKNGGELAIRLEAIDEEMEYGPISIDGIEAGQMNLLLYLTEDVRTFSIVPMSDNGRELEKVVVSTEIEGWSYFDKRTEFTKADLEKNGSIRMLRPLVPFELKVTVRGYETAELGPYHPETAPEVIEVPLKSVSPVEGRILAGGEPVQGARVSIHRARNPEMILKVNGFLVRYEGKSTADGVTDEAGGFSLFLQSSGEYFIRAEADGWSCADIGPITIDHKRGKRGLELDLSGGGSIHGYIVSTPGRNMSGLLVTASRGDGHELVTRTSEDGVFAFDHMTPGKWLVEHKDRIQNRTTQSSVKSQQDDPAAVLIANGGEYPWNCVVEEEKITPFSLNLQAVGKEESAPLCVLEGRVLFNGRTYPAWTAVLEKHGSLPLSGRLAEASVDRNGEFTLRIDKPGKYRLLLLGNQGENAMLTAVMSPVTLRTGRNTPWFHDFNMGEVTVQGLPEPMERLLVSPGISLPAHLYKWEGDDGSEVFVELRPEGHPGYGPSSVPAGPGKVIRIEETKRVMGFLVNYKESDLKNAVVVAGGLTVVEL